MIEQHPFKWRHFEAEIILVCVRWYLRYALSYRDLEELMLERVLSELRTRSKKLAWSRGKIALKGTKRGEQGPQKKPIWDERGETFHLFSGRVLSSGRTR